MGRGRLSPSTFFHQLRSPRGVRGWLLFSEATEHVYRPALKICTVSLLREHISWVAYDGRRAVDESRWRKVRQVGSFANAPDLQVEVDESGRARLAHEPDDLARLQACADGMVEEPRSG